MAERARDTWIASLRFDKAGIGAGRRGKAARPGELRFGDYVTTSRGS
ncbi:MAG: hypothetical protein U0235_26050 [Polyangiaceae bacterium]